MEEKNKALTVQIEQLTQSLSVVTKDLEQVKKINAQLQENISKLFNTAKTELARKTQMITDLQQQLDDLLFRRKGLEGFRIPKKRKLNENIPVNNIEDVTVKKIKIDDEKRTVEVKVCTDNKNTPNQLPKNRRLNQPNRYRRSQDRSIPRRRYRSRTRSRERNRRSPPRYRRDSRRNRENSRDRRDRRHTPPDIDHRSYETDCKSYLKTFKKRELERNSDSESIISVKSSSSIEEIMVISDRRNSKTMETKDVKKCVVGKDKSKVKKTSSNSEPEEGEISDDFIESLTMKIGNDCQKLEPVMDNDSAKFKREVIKENCPDIAPKIKKIDMDQKENISLEKDPCKQKENSFCAEKVTGECHETEKNILLPNTDVNVPKKPEDDSKMAERNLRIKNKQEFLFGNDSVDFEETLMCHHGLNELEAIQKHLENELKNETGQSDLPNLKLPEERTPSTQKLNENKKTKEKHSNTDTPAPTTSQVAPEYSPAPPESSSSVPSTSKSDTLLTPLTTKPESLNLSQNKSVRRRRCILTIQ